VRNCQYLGVLVVFSQQVWVEIRELAVLWRYNAHRILGSGKLFTTIVLPAEYLAADCPPRSTRKRIAAFDLVTDALRPA
jgi:hypothetical protein